MRSNLDHPGLRHVRETVAALRAALLAPSVENLDAQMPALQQAADNLVRLAQSGPPPDARRELQALSNELRAVSKLIVHGLTVAQTMARLLAPASTSYRADGEPALPRTSSTLAVRG